MKIITLVQQLMDLSPRFAQGEEKTAEFIKNFLKGNAVEFIDQQYQTTVPFCKKAYLEVDGKPIDCRSVGLEGGTFVTKDSLVSSLFWSDEDFYYPQNINFNPQCKNSVSMALFYKHAALAIRRDDVEKVLKAQKITGETIVEPYTFTAHNYLVGNTINPENIIFTHYDCWETGAIDNASGTAVLLDSIITNKNILDKNLIVIAGNEEISYDEPIFWGHGYRVFQEKHKEILSKTQKIIVVDCVGYSDHIWVTDPSYMMYALPLSNFEEYKNKCTMLKGSYQLLREVYHSNDDTIDLLSETKLQDAKKIFLKEIR